MSTPAGPIERQLRDAQAAVEAAREATVRRQQAVKAALGAGWSKYRIAKTLGVSATTVDSIVRTLERKQPETEATQE